jgi:hypothetical protein
MMADDPEDEPPIEDDADDVSIEELRRQIEELGRPYDPWDEAKAQPVEKPLVPPGADPWNFGYYIDSRPEAVRMRHTRAKCPVGAAIPEADRFHTANIFHIPRGFSDCPDCEKEGRAAWEAQFPTPEQRQAQAAKASTAEKAAERRTIRNAVLGLALFIGFEFLVATIDKASGATGFVADVFYLVPVLFVAWWFTER